MLDKLSRLVVDSDEFTLIDARTHQFCPFEAIGMVRQEIRHSNFLAYLLDPARPHGIGDVALRAFLMTLAEGNSAQRLDFHFRDLSSAKIWRERDHIDILIEIPPGKSKGLVVAIEIKVDASERDAQLSDYANRVTARYPRREWDTLFCFLTPDGRDGQSHGSSDWASLSFGELLSALEAAITREGITGEGTKLFDFYHSMMKRHDIVKDSPDPELDRAVQAIWAKHKEALEFLIANRPDPLNDLLLELDENQASFAEALSEAVNFNIAPDSRVHRWRRFSFPALSEDFPKMFDGDTSWIASGAQLVLELTAENDTIVASFAVGPSCADNELRENLINALNEQAKVRYRKANAVRHYWRGPILSWEELADQNDHFSFLKSRTIRFVSNHLSSVKAALQSISVGPDYEG